MQDFLNLVYQNSMIPIIHKLNKKTVTAIDHIFTDTFVNRTFISGNFKTDMSDHFPVIFLILSIKLSNED